MTAWLPLIIELGLFYVLELPFYNVDFFKRERKKSMKFLFIKPPSILRDGVIGVLKEELFPVEVEAVEPNHKRLRHRIHESDLIIIDIDSSNFDIKITIDYCVQKNKKVIVWTSDLYHQDLVELFKMGIQGYFYNGMEKEELINGVNLVINGNLYIHNELSSVLLGDYRKINNKEPKRPVGVFTNREWDVMELLIKGYSNESIGGKLFITDRTVKTHVSSILRKLDVPDRTNIVLTALKNEWFYV